MTSAANHELLPLHCNTEGTWILSCSQWRSCEWASYFQCMMQRSEGTELGFERTCCVSCYGSIPRLLCFMLWFDPTAARFQAMIRSHGCWVSGEHTCEPFACLSGDFSYLIISSVSWRLNGQGNRKLAKQRVTNCRSWQPSALSEESKRKACLGRLRSG
jgi:hypothetical protein